MINVVFVLPDGSKSEVGAAEGQSIMQAAMSNMVPGVVGECGGEMSCATCHVYVDEQWLDKLPGISQDEIDMLEVTSEEPTSCSRLSCQVRLNASMDGLIVNIPKTQK